MHQFRKAVVWGCIGFFSTCSYFDLRSNAVPLAFGMTPEEAASALELPLTRVTARHGSEIYFTERTTLTTGLYARDRHLWLQFRNGRLTGWRNDWDRPAW